MSRLPTLFIPHGGGPCFFMDSGPPDTWERMAESLRRVPDDVGTRPKALVVISGHWEEKIAPIQNNPDPPLLYHYYGFPQSTYQISFPWSPEHFCTDRRIVRGGRYRVEIRSSFGASIMAYSFR